MVDKRVYATHTLDANVGTSHIGRKRMQRVKVENSITGQPDTSPHPSMVIQATPSNDPQLTIQHLAQLLAFDSDCDEKNGCTIGNDSHDDEVSNVFDDPGVSTSVIQRGVIKRSGIEIVYNQQPSGIRATSGSLTYDSLLYGQYSAKIKLGYNLSNLLTHPWL